MQLEQRRGISEGYGHGATMHLDLLQVVRCARDRECPCVPVGAKFESSRDLAGNTEVAGKRARTLATTYVICASLTG